LDNKQQVLVATATKTLQTQALTKDIPQLERILDLGNKDFKFVRLVGSNNHLCQLLYKSIASEQADFFEKGKDFEKNFASLYFELIFFHNKKNPSNPITREAIPYALKRCIPEIASLELEIAVDFRSCTGRKCPVYRDCSYMTGLKMAKQADVIIGNHALMLTWPKGLPRPMHMIVDEAHKLEAEATRAFSLILTQEQLIYFSKSLQTLQGVGALFYLMANAEMTHEIEELKKEFTSKGEVTKDHLAALEPLIESLFKQAPRYSTKYWNELPMIQKKGAQDATSLAIFNHFESLEFILKDMVNMLTPYLAKWDVESFKEDSEIMAYTRFEAYFTQLDEILSVLSMALSNNTEYVHGLKYKENQGFSLESSPINVGEKIYENILDASSSVIFTSATLANMEGNKGERGIEWATGYTYLPSEKRFRTGLYLPPIYDYQNKSRIYLCTDVLPLYDSQFVPEIFLKIIPVIKRLKGRSLLLFSARERFEIAREILLAELQGKIPLFIQGMGSHVVDDFKKHGQGILLGMESFGEGIDVPGDALQFVFIDKVPDMRMDLIIQRRRDFFERKFGNEFTDYFLSYRVRSLQQKLGRLLRTEHDRGSAIIVDTRIKRWQSRTWENFQQLMRPYELEKISLDKACQGVIDFIC